MKQDIDVPLQEEQEQEHEHEHQNQQNQQDRAVLIIGSSKSGKTKMCEQILDNMRVDTSSNNGLSILRPMYETLESHMDLVELCSNFLMTSVGFSDIVGINTKTITGSRERETVDIKKKVIVFDDVDILLSQDRYANTYIQSLLKNVIVILTCSVCEERRVTEIKKKCQVIRLDRPPKSRCPLNLDPEINPYFDMNIYQLVDTVFDQYQGEIHDLELAIFSDPTLINFIMYDNFKHVFSSRSNLPHPRDAKFCERISRMYTLTSQLEDNAYLMNDTNMVDMLSLVRCYTIRCCQKELSEVMAPISKSTSTSASASASTIAYTQIASRSAQHHNVSKKHMTIELTPLNVAILSELKHHKKETVSMKTTLGAVCQAYIYNVCKK